MPFTDFVPYDEVCRHPEHNPPGLIVLKPGRHTYVCPGCGATALVDVPKVTC